jgi:hypothetical protein
LSPSRLATLPTRAAVLATWRLLFMKSLLEIPLSDIFPSLLRDGLEKEKGGHF